MRKPAKIVSLASALAALAAPAGAPPLTGAADSDRNQLAIGAGEGMETKAETGPPVRVELMSFTVVQTSDGEMFPQHVSHASHASHVSGIGIPDGPDLPSPSWPIPSGGGSSGGSAATAAPTADPVATACARATAGYGVKDIVTELEQSFSLSASDAQSIAKQALSASLNGGPYCAGSRGG
jgi:hypothetical protein